MREIRMFLLSSLSLKRLLYLILVTLTAFALSHSMSGSQRYWLVWSALFFSQITLGNSFKKRIFVIVLTGVLTAIVVFIAGSLTSQLLLLTLFLSLVTFLGVLLGLLLPEIFFLTFIINLFALAAGGIPPGLNENSQRFFYILGGTAIAVVWQILFWFHFFRNEIQSFLMISLHNMKQLSKAVFTCFLQPEFVENRYVFERRLHVRKNRVMYAMKQLRDCGNQANQFSNLFSHLEHFYEIILDCAQLRYRVTDFTVFAICRNELAAICHELEKVFNEMIRLVEGKASTLDISPFMKKIELFSANYQKVLQITAREPLVFLLFIDSLNAFCEEARLFFEKASK